MQLTSIESSAHIHTNYQSYLALGNFVVVLYRARDLSVKVCGSTSEPVGVSNRSNGSFHIDNKYKSE